MAWAEDVSASGFELCLRELQNFDGVHQDISASWMAFDYLHRPLFKEHGLIHFSNRQPPPKRGNFAFCKHRQFSRPYSHVPSVLLTPTIATKGKPSDGAVAWVEQVNVTWAKICVKQVYDSGYSPLTVHYAVLSDINECGISDSCHVNAKCTNIAGSYTCACKPGFSGNGLNCTDIDECTSGTHGCHANAQCRNTIGSYTCHCNSGHAGNGRSCSDADECGTGSHGCHADARCINPPGSYICRCNAGFHGDCKTCFNIENLLKT
ncbi:adhesion G protein-coupled receptor E2-like [Nematostella vectensis]|uniref:adhesion G protein-coupled receptor E2-like n=1 Tax=Nematostella vectensis TaxID=45351 RepID=UPI002076E935|nr:adhesion G protein-coupled receptor E2-like [Nematostella vectensis]